MTDENKKEISIIDLIESLNAFKIQIILTSLFLASLFFLSSYFVSTLYINKSFVVINEDISKPELDSSLAALASFGGLELESDKNDEFIAIINSKKFIYSFLLKEELLSKEKNSDAKIENHLEEIKSFKKNLKIIKIPRSSTYEFSFISPDISLANEIPNKIVSYSNEYIKKQKKQSLSNELNFLESTFSIERNEEIKRMIASLIQKNLQSQTLAFANIDYPFKFVDEAIFQKEIFSPNKIVRFFIGFLLGLFISILWAFSKAFKIS